MPRQSIQFVRLHPDAVLPTRATKLSFGYDLSTYKEERIEAGETRIIPTGWKLGRELPTVEMALIGADGPEITGGVGMLILPRSSLPLKYNVTVANSPGLIDADYPGEIGVIVHNSGDTAVVLPPKTRFAQFILSYLDFFPVEEVAESTLAGERTGGFGSTGA